jgi:hypothetical protein
MKQKNEINTKNEDENLVDDQEFFEETEDLSADDFMSGEINFLKNPAVGESIEFTLSGVKKQNAKKIKNPKTGKNMDITLSSVDYYYDFLDEDGKTLTVTSWQVVGKTKAILKKLKASKYNVPLRITHVADGMKTAKGVDAWKVFTKVSGEWKELDREKNEWI